MDYQSLHMKTVADLRKLAKEMGVRVPAGTKKNVLIDLLLEADAAQAKSAAKAEPVQAEAPADIPAQEAAVEAPADAPAPKCRGRQAKATAPKEEMPKVAEPPKEEVPAAQPPKEEPVKEESGEEPPKEEAAQPEAKEEAAETKSEETEEKADSSEEKPDVSEEKPDAAEEKSEAAEEKPEASVTAEAKPAEADRRPEGQPVHPYYRTYPRQGADNRQGYGNFRNNGGEQNRPYQRPRYGSYAEGQPSRPVQGEGQGGFRSAPRPVQGETAPRTFQRPVQPDSQRTGEAAQGRPQEYGESGSARGRREGYYNAEYKTSNPAVPEMLAAGECNDGAGVLEIQQDGYGFLRAENCLPGPNDVYISIAQIRRFNLREGDHVVGKTRPQREGDRYSAMLYITSVNGAAPEETAGRPRFEDLVPIYPDQRLRMETPDPQGKEDLSLRLVDMLAPIGKGQRGMIVSQPKAGKTTLLKKIANAITANSPEVELIVLLIDERPEEVTDMKRSIQGEVVYSTFDEAPENHVRVSEMVLARAQRLVEMGRDVVVLMDSITRLARAYNLVITPTGRSLSGGLDPGALFKPKRFFGAARNIENGGSLTVIATALVDTGSRMDDIIFEEFKGTGNMELHLDRKLSDKRVFPAIDMVRSGTRREELLLTEAELEGEMLVRRVLSGSRPQEMTEQIIELMSKTSTNAEFFEKLKGWLAVFEKEGYTFGGKG